MSHMIKSTTINFKELVKNSNTTLSLDVQSKIVDKLNNTFTENEQHWYIAAYGV
jgi:23S rRNA maturation mini-RNase III